MPIAPQRMLVFADERYKAADSYTTIVMGCCIFLRRHWLNRSQKAAKVGQVKSKRQLEAIEDVLETIHGVAVVTHANVSRLHYVPGEIDTTPDIMAMSRTDNIWSQMMAFSICAGVAWLHRSGMPLGVVDMYYDRKDLTTDHRAAFEAMIRKNIPQTARDAATEYPERFSVKADHLMFGAIKQISKPGVGTQPSPYQQGTMLAHHVCSQSEKVITRGEQGRFLVKDFTAQIAGIVQIFTEVSPSVHVV